jgi:magnesium transporter
MALDTDRAEAADDEVFGVSERLFDAVLDAVEAEDAGRLDGLLDPLHAADIAALLGQLTARDRRALLTLWKGGMDGDILSELDDSLRGEVIDGLAPAELAEVVRELESDDVVDLVEDLPEAQAEAVLGALAGPDRAVVEQALTFPEGSAGRLMQVEVARVPEHWLVAEAADYLRSGAPLPDQFYHVVLVDPRMKPVGYVTLGRILSAPPATRLAAITEDSFRTFEVTDDAAEVARAFSRYHLISAPVVDADGRLMGVITIDDAVLVLDERHEEDMLALGGVRDSALSDTVWRVTWQRLPWLGVNLATAILASLVIGLFEEALAGLVALAILMPIVASMGGNAGTQSLTVAVRAIATRELTGSNMWRVIWREGAVGAINGLVFAVVMGVVGFLWFGSPGLGLVIAAAMVINLVAAGLSGVAIPVVLDRLRVDPAISSGTFVTTVTDVVGFFAFLGLASWLLL